MREYTQFYINGNWVDPVTPKALEVLDPSTEEPCATISLGTEADVDQAVAAAKAARETFSQTSLEERVGLLERMAEIFQRRIREIAEAIRLEMGAPIKLASTAQAYAGLGHITEAAKIIWSLKITAPSWSGVFAEKIVSRRSGENSLFNITAFCAYSCKESSFSTAIKAPTLFSDIR